MTALPVERRILFFSRCAAAGRALFFNRFSSIATDCPRIPSGRMHRRPMRVLHPAYSTALLIAMMSLSVNRPEACFSFNVSSR